MDTKLNEGALFHLRFNLKWMSFIGMWHLPNYKQPFLWITHRLFAIISVLLTYFVTLSGVIGFFRGFKYERELLPTHALLFSMETMLVANGLFFLIKRSVLNQVLNRFQKCYNLALRINPLEFVSMIEPWIKLARRLSIFWTFLVLYSGIHWFSVPLFNMIHAYYNTLHSNDTEIPKTLSYVGWYPYDKWTSIYYEFTFFSESVASVIYVYYFGVTDSFVIAFLILCCGFIDHLMKCIQRMEENSQLNQEIQKDKKLINFNIKNCVQLHREVFRLFEDFQMFVSPLMLSQSLRTLCALCLFSLDFITVKPGDTKFVILIEYVILYSTQFFLYTWFASEVTKMGSKVATEIYSSNWVMASVNYQKKIAFMIMRAQKSLLLKGGPFFFIDLSLLIQMYRTSFSIFTILRQMQEE